MQTPSLDMNKVSYPPDNLLAQMDARLTKAMRDSGLTVTVETEPSGGPEFQVRFPPNRPKSPPKT